ncbi:hypothetical protein P12x_004131 [Tundrisphaera lichenicola]|uniref:hypothetical protein n=1 Tax=Tundrisphaera lichenicola TaxID=2029860 RepID=UPI003EB99760
MRRDRITRAIPAIGLGLALSYTSETLAQGLPPSSGSGSGTGTGMSSGFPGATGTGRESGTIGSTGTGREGLSTSPLPRAFPSADLTRPIDRRGIPGIDDGRPLGGLSNVSPTLLTDARSVADPGERALALVRIAQTAIFSRQMDEAHAALFEAGPAALAAPNHLIRDQRITAIVSALLNLAEERMSDYSDFDYSMPEESRSSSESAPPTPPPAESVPPRTAGERTPAAALPPDTRKARLQAAVPEWAEAVRLARTLENITARTETLFRIVESEAFSSSRLITDPLRLVGGQPDPAKLSPDLRTFTDQLLVSASQHAAMIERPIWKNYASYSIISNAAASSQFPRGFQIARDMEQPEARTDALIRLAEGQALNGRPEEATAAYNEAARSVSMIPQEDPRETLVGVLIDSLITFGRFDDARACVPLYSFPSRQLTALSAVAESQGRRGLSESARLWIAREAPPSFRAILYRKVNDGVLTAIEKNRSKDLSLKGR